MNYLLFAITEHELDDETINDFEAEGIFITNYSEHIKEGIVGHFYYEISNGDTKNFDVNPYDRIEEMHDVIEAIHELGKYRLVIIDTKQELNALLDNENGNLEKAFNGLPQVKIGLDDLLEKYPQGISPNTLYIVD